MTNSQFLENKGITPQRERIHAIALAAFKHANDIIKTSATREKEGSDAQKILQNAIEEMRNECENLSQSNVALDPWIAFFEYIIESLHQRHIGNCNDFAVLVADYVQRHAPDLKVEVYSLMPGDHAFVVIGRADKSNINDPSAWGNDCYICDAWISTGNEEDSVYPAAEWQKKLKPYTPGVSLENCRIMPMPDLSSIHRTPYFKEYYKNFLEMAEKLAADAKKLQQELDRIVTRLRTNYGENDDKYKLLHEKLTVLNSHLANLNQFLIKHRQLTKNADYPQNVNQYREAKAELSKMLQTHEKIITYSAKEESILKKYSVDPSSNLSKVKHKAMGLFGVNTSEFKDLNSALHEAETNYQKIRAMPKKIR